MATPAPAAAAPAAAADITTKSLFDVSGLVAVVTGGGTGIGAMMARTLDANGAKAVYIVGRRRDPLDQVAAQCANGSIRPVVGDVTSKESLETVAQKVKEEVGYIDVFCANAGVSGIKLGPRAGEVKTLSEFKEKLWAAPMSSFTETLHVNVTATFYSVLAFAELLEAGNAHRAATRDVRSIPPPPWAHVLITASGAAFARSVSLGFDYSASKAAVAHLTKMLATALAPYRVRVNGLAPGFFPSDMVSQNPVFRDSAAADPRVEGSVPFDVTPLGRVGSEFDMAGAVMFLLSPAAAYTTGNILLLDGGRISMIPATY